MRTVLVLFLSLFGNIAHADAWGDCRDSLKAEGAIFSTDSSVSGITLTQTLAGLNAEPTTGKEPIVTITFENGGRAVLDERNTFFLSRWKIVHELMNVGRDDIGSYFILKNGDLALVRAKDGCRPLGIVTAWPLTWATN